MTHACLSTRLQILFYSITQLMFLHSILMSHFTFRKIFLLYSKSCVSLTHEKISLSGFSTIVSNYIICWIIFHSSILLLYFINYKQIPCVRMINSFTYWKSTVLAQLHATFIILTRCVIFGIIKLSQSKETRASTLGVS